MSVVGAEGPAGGPGGAPAAGGAAAAGAAGGTAEPSNAVTEPIVVLSRFSSACDMYTVDPSTRGGTLRPRRESLKFQTALPVRG